MDFIEGTRLSTFLREPPEDDQAEMILDPNIDDEKLDAIYDQIADYLLQISRLGFPRIGSLSKDGTSETWTVTGRPLTFNMAELATLTGYPPDEFPVSPFDSARDFFRVRGASVH